MPKFIQMPHSLEEQILLHVKLKAFFLNSTVFDMFKDTFRLAIVNIGIPLWHMFLLGHHGGSRFCKQGNVSKPKLLANSLRTLKCHTIKCCVDIDLMQSV